MQRLLLLVCLLARGAAATEVEAIGYGSSAEEALNNAKTAAIEQVAGTFVTGRSQVDHGSYHQRIDQYHGGHIRHYEVLGSMSNDGLIVMRIRAEVDPDKVNAVAVNRGGDISAATVDQLNADREDARRTGRILDALDDPARAYVVQLLKTSYRNRGDKVAISLEGHVFLNPKWVDDLKILARTMNRPVDLGSRWSDIFWAMSALSAMVNPMLPGPFGYLAQATQARPQTGDDYMACFGDDPGRDVDECHLIRYPLYRLSRTGRWQIQVTIDTANGPLPIERFPINIDPLLPEVRSGQRVYFRRSASERRFGFPGVLVYGKVAMPFQHILTVSPETLQQGRPLLLSLEEQVVNEQIFQHQYPSQPL